MTRIATAKHVACPKCSTTTEITCLRKKNEDTIRIRYRKCPSCSHKFKTSQQISPSIGPEVITPYHSAEEICSIRSSKLNEHDVLDILDLLSKGVYSRRDLALQYEVTYSAIRSIAVGRTWKHLTAAPS